MALPAALPGSGLLAVGFASPPSVSCLCALGFCSLAGSLAPASLFSPRVLGCLGMDFWRPSTDFVVCCFASFFGGIGVSKIYTVQFEFQIFSDVFVFSGFSLHLMWFFVGESGSEIL